MQSSSTQLQKAFTRQLDQNSVISAAENVRLQDEIMSVIQYSQRECGKARESQRRGLETRISAIEEVSIPSSCYVDRRLSV